MIDQNSSAVIYPVLLGVQALNADVERMLLCQLVVMQEVVIGKVQKLCKAFPACPLLSCTTQTCMIIVSANSQLRCSVILTLNFGASSTLARTIHRTHHLLFVLINSICTPKEQK